MKLGTSTALLIPFFTSAIGAQGAAGSEAASNLQLSVRPREMAIGTQTVSAGEQTLDSFPGYLIYVPKQAVGTRRVPLIVTLAGGGIDSRDVMDLEKPVADKYGMILFAPDISGPVAAQDQIAALDAGMKQVLRRFAIDPEKIALTGMSNGGALTLDIGCENLSIFSLIAALSPVPFDAETCTDSTSAEHRKAQILMSNGIAEPNQGMADLLKVAPRLQHDGYSVVPVIGLRPHSRILRDRFFVWQWCLDRWAAPGNPDSRISHPKPVPELTDKILAKMMKFWKQFSQEPDSIRQIASWDAFEVGDIKRVGVDRTTVVIPLGTEPVLVSDILDMRALAATYPSIKAALASAGLTPSQEEHYQTAFISARATKIAQDSKARVSIKATPIVQRNVRFITEHASAVNQLLDNMEILRCEATPQAQYGC